MRIALRPTVIARLAGTTVEYRIERRGDSAVVIAHGEHLHAGVALDENMFRNTNYTILVPSRPGYGRTPLSAGRSVTGFADITRELCSLEGIRRVAAAVGVSYGAPTAIALAARHPDLIERLILINAVDGSWRPDRRARLLARTLFGAATEGATWAALRALARIAPEPCPRLILKALSTSPVGDAMAELTAADRDRLLELIAMMRSGQGFVHDLRPSPSVAASVHQPTMVITTRHDRAAPFPQALRLASTIPRAELVDIGSDAPLLWRTRDWSTISQAICTFLATPPQPTTSPLAR